MDRTDAAWNGVESLRLVLDVEVPPVADVREALRDVAIGTPIGVWVDLGRGGWSAVDAVHADRWLDRVVVAADESAPTPERAGVLSAQPLHDLPLRLVIGPDWYSLRLNHALGDGWSALSLLGHVLAVARGEKRAEDRPWRHPGIVTRSTVVVRAAHRARALARAVSQRAVLRGGPYEPARRRAETSHWTFEHRVSADGLPSRLRGIRDAHHPGASMAGLLIAGLRRELETALGPVRPGGEFVFNTRAGATAHAFGNLSAGLYLTPGADDSPVEVSRLLAGTRASGLPDVAVAATRVRRRPRPGAERMVAAPTGAARLAVSFLNAHGPLGDLPGLRPTSLLVQPTVPNGVETVVVTAMETGDRIQLTVSFHPDRWSSDRIAAAIDAFFLDPGRTLDGPGRREAIA